MPPLSQQILQSVEVLPEEDQKQILDFVEFLRAKRERSVRIETDEGEVVLPFADVAKAFIGAGAGPSDIATNPAYMQGYGQ